MARFRVLKWVLVTGSLLGASGCLVSFDHYAEGDVCDAGRDAGIPLRTAPDPVLRGCDAGPEPEPKPAPADEANGNAGSAGAEDSP